MLQDFEVFRAKNLINNIVKKLNLQLTGLSVLTEAGSNYFIYTPIIAYYAGASKIFVWIKDTTYGNAIDIQKKFYEIIEMLEIDSKAFQFALNERNGEHVRQTDIVTNLGFVRPINREFIDLLKPNSVISYMCEAWEIRPNDVDIAYCKAKGIPVAGVWENHPELLIFNGCEPLAVKVCLEAGFEIYQNNILIISSDKFGKAAYETFEAFGAKKVVMASPKDIDMIDFNGFDFLFVADYSIATEIIGKGISEKLNQLQKSAVIHLCGRVDQQWLKTNDVYCYPKQQGFSFRMTRTLAHLGLKPVIDLHASGLKVGESLFKRRKSTLIQVI